MPFYGYQFTPLRPSCIIGIGPYCFSYVLVPIGVRGEGDGMGELQPPLPFFPPAVDINIFFFGKNGSGTPPLTSEQQEATDLVNWSTSFWEFTIYSKIVGHTLNMAHFVTQDLR